MVGMQTGREDGRESSLAPVAFDDVADDDMDDSACHGHDNSSDVGEIVQEASPSVPFPTFVWNNTVHLFRRVWEVVAGKSPQEPARKRKRPEPVGIPTFTLTPPHQIQSTDENGSTAPVTDNGVDAGPSSAKRQKRETDLARSPESYSAPPMHTSVPPIRSMGHPRGSEAPTNLQYCSPIFISSPLQALSPQSPPDTVSRRIIDIDREEESYLRYMQRTPRVNRHKSTPNRRKSKSYLTAQAIKSSMQSNPRATTPVFISSLSPPCSVYTQEVPPANRNSLFSSDPHLRFLQQSTDARTYFDRRIREREAAAKLAKLRHLSEDYARREEWFLLGKKPEKDDDEAEKNTSDDSAHIQPLTEAEEEQVAEVFDADANMDEELPNGITRGHMQCLVDREWLNDEIVNGYVKVLLKRFPKSHFFNSFFTTKLTGPSGDGYNYASVRRWTRRAKLHEKDYAFVPVHIINHWTMAVINFKDEQFEYYDSLGGTNDELLEKLKVYIADEWKDKVGEAKDFSSWKFFTPEDIPHQQNTCDCGVFMLKFAEYLAAGRPVNFHQRHIPNFRKRMVIDVMGIVV